MPMQDYKRGFLGVMLSACCLAAQAGDATGKHVRFEHALIDIGTLPQWLQEAMAKESDVSQRSLLEVKPLGVKQEVLGKVELVDTAEDAWIYTIDIGSESPLECYATTDYDGIANSLHAFVTTGLEFSAEQNEKALSNVYNYAMGAGAINGAPYLQLDSLYSLGEPGQNLLGLMKGAAAETAGVIQVCIHAEIGYRRTFIETFVSFVSAFAAADSREAFFESISRIHVNEIPMGVTRERYFLDHEGDVESRLSSAMLLPVDASSVARLDSASVYWNTPDGNLINASEYTVQNGALLSEFSIQTAGEAWQVTGEMQGKAVEAALDYKGELLGPLGVYLHTAALMQGDQAKSEHPYWISQNPTATLDVKIEKLEKQPNANIRIDMGPIVMEGRVDADGNFLRVDVDQGPLQMAMDQIYVKGRPRVDVE